MLSKQRVVQMKYTWKMVLKCSIKCFTKNNSFVSIFLVLTLYKNSGLRIARIRSYNMFFS